MYKDMSLILQDSNAGDWSISHFKIKGTDFRAMLDGIPQGNYVKLSHMGKCIMSNTPMGKRTNSDFVLHAHGDVLIGGLGLGMIILAIQGKEDVLSITVLEKNKEVIDLIQGQLPLNGKVRIIHADAFEWKPKAGQRFDCVYMDIWSGISRDVYEKQMKPLKRKYGHYLKSKSESPNRFNKCWAEWNAKTGYRLY